jgi:MFS family permease
VTVTITITKITEGTRVRAPDRSTGVDAVVGALRRSVLRRVVLAYLVFAMAEWGSWVAVLVWAYDLGGMDAAAIVSVAQLVPATVVAPLGAALGDRMRRGHALALGYVAQGVAMLATASALESGASLAVVATTAAVMTCAISLTRPVHSSLLPSLASEPGEVVAGNAATGTADSLGACLGPLACGLLITPGGPELVLGTFGIMLLGAGVAVLGVEERSWLVAVRAALDRRQRTAAVPAPERLTRPGAGAEALAGVRALREDRPVAVLVLLVFAEYVVIGVLDILLLVIAFEVLGTAVSGPGLLAGALGVGAIVGAVASVLLVGRSRLSPALLTGAIAVGSPLLLVPLGERAAAVAVLLAVCGAGKGFFDVATRTLMQRAVPDRVSARVFGLAEAAMSGALAVGAVLAPLAVHTLGAGGAVVATGLLLPLAGVASWRPLARLDRESSAYGRYVTLLRALPMLRPATLPLLERLSRSAVEQHVEPGATVVREGETGDRFYVVLDGEVAVSRGGRELRRQHAGEGFGEIALLRDVPRTATVTATAPTVLVSLSRDDFLAAVGSAGAVHAVAQAQVQHWLDEDSA